MREEVAGAVGKMIDALEAVVDGVVQAFVFIVSVVGIFILMAAFGLASAFVARDYWNWFVAPLGMPPVGLLHAYGLIIFAGLLRGIASNQHHDESESVAEAVSKPLVGLALTWGLGWLIVTLAGPF